MKNRASSSGTRLRERLERVGQRHAVVLLVVEQPELGASRIRDFVGDHRHAGRERVAGAQRAGDEVDRLRKLILELAHATRGRAMRTQMKGTAADGERGDGAEPHDRRSRAMSTA